MDIIDVNMAARSILTSAMKTAAVCALIALAWLPADGKAAETREMPERSFRHS